MNNEDMSLGDSTVERLTKYLSAAAARVTEFEYRRDTSVIVMAALIRALRDKGVTWWEIGRALGGSTELARSYVKRGEMIRERRQDRGDPSGDGDRRVTEES